MTHISWRHEHNAPLLTELGYSPSEQAALVESGAV
jgi:hypothetical protein